MDLELKNKKVLVSGASGFVGNSVVRSMQAQGYEVYKLVRRATKTPMEIEWHPDRSTLDQTTLSLISPSIVIHLAGENILGFWTEQKKREILESRTKGTKLLADALASLDTPPSLFISASGCTYYGSDISIPVDETHPKGNGFFADVVEKWESACETLKQTKRTRVCYLRFGIVLDPSGGFISKIYYPFLFGLGGVLGTGQQWLPWISLNDVLAIIHYIIQNDRMEGPYNLSSPNPVTNFEFTKTMGRVLNRPTICWVPSFVLTMVLGEEMAYQTVLSSQRVIPSRLMESGYNFMDISLEKLLVSQLLNTPKLAM